MSKRFKHRKIVPTVVLYLFIFTLIVGLSSIDNFYVFSQPHDQVAPRTPQDFSIKVGTRSAEIFWKENGELDLFNYVLYLRTGEEKEGGKPILLGKTNYHKLDNLNENTTYYISLAARDKDKNESKTTPEIGFTPDDPLGQDFGVNAWIQASSDLDDARQSFIDNAEIFASISPFWYSAQADGAVERRGDIMTEAMNNTARDKGVRIVPSITNNFDEDSKLSNLLQNDEATGRHIAIIMNEVVSNNYDGIDIDYENLDPAVKNKYTSFIQKLAEELHKKEKIISVTVQAKQSDAQSWSGAGALDFTKLGEVADQFRIMTYDYSRANTAPGPIAPVYWMQEVVEYAKSKMPPEKIVVGIPFYGYLWCTTGNHESCQNKGLTWEGVNNLITKYDPTIERNNVAQTPWFIYVDENNNNMVVNYEDHQSLAAKLDAIKKLDVAGIAIWRLGSEDPQNFPTIKDKLGKKIMPPRSLQTAPQNNAIKLSWEKSSDSNIKGYRVFIRQKSEIDGNDNSLPTNNSATDTNQVDNSNLWQEKHIDVFDVNEYLLTGLKNGKPYYLSVAPLTWSIDDSEAFLSEQEKQNRTSQPIIATPADLYYPGKIEELKIENTGTDTVELSWSTPGDENFDGQATKFDLRYSDKEITTELFPDAIKYEHLPTPEKPSTGQKWRVEGLEPGVKYYFAIKTEDEVGNVSDLSNVVSTETIDDIPPQVPAAPSVSALSGELFVSWEANQDKDLAGYKLFFRQEKSYYNVVEIDKERTNYTLRDLENNYNYYVGLSAIDTHDNESARGEDAIGYPHEQKSIGRAKGFLAKSSVKIKATLATFSKKLFNDKAIPFIVVISVIVINFFIFQGLKREINKKPGKKDMLDSVKTRPKSDKVIDLKNIRRTLR
ncbi:fibronectin type III domain-containing protein [Patescibacteria group bacterium]|nr:fibronectin type III domain-containing protein [Patescibacteria group bacterium]